MLLEITWISYNSLLFQIIIIFWSAQSDKSTFTPLPENKKYSILIIIIYYFISPIS